MSLGRPLWLVRQSGTWQESRTLYALYASGHLAISGETGTMGQCVRLSADELAELTRLVGDPAVNALEERQQTWRGADGIHITLEIVAANPGGARRRIDVDTEGGVADVIAKGPEPLRPLYARLDQLATSGRGTPCTLRH